jgi:hypothetical protein
MIFALFLLFAFTFLWFKPTRGLKSLDLTGVFLFKILLGWLFMYVYSRIYGVGAETVDWEEFIHDSVVLRNVAFEDFGTYLKFLFGFSTEADVQHYLMGTNHWAAGDLAIMNDSRNVLRVNSLIAFLFNGNVYYHIGFISFFVVLCFRELYLVLDSKVWLNKRIFWWILLVFPSVAFWTASMLKEPFLIMGFCLLFSALFGNHKNYSFWWRLILGIVLLLAFKPYVFFCLIFPVLIFVLYRWMRLKQAISYSVLITVFTLILIAFPNIRTKGVHQLTRMQFDFINIGHGGVHVLNGNNFYFFSPETLGSVELKNDSLYLLKPVTAKLVTTGMKLPFDDIRLKPEDGPWVVYFKGLSCGSYFEITPINGSFTNLLKNMPEALTNAAFRPFPTDNGSWLKWLNFLETLGLFSAILITWFSKRIKQTKEHKQMIIVLLMFSISLLLLVGWVTPVMGALVRYRMPAYLALVLIACLGKRSIQKT